MSPPTDLRRSNLSSRSLSALSSKLKGATRTRLETGPGIQSFRILQAFPSSMPDCQIRIAAHYHQQISIVSAGLIESGARSPAKAAGSSKAGACEVDCITSWTVQICSDCCFEPVLTNFDDLRMRVFKMRRSWFCNFILFVDSECNSQTIFEEHASLRRQLDEAGEDSWPCFKVGKAKDMSCAFQLGLFPVASSS